MSDAIRVFSDQFYKSPDKSCFSVQLYHLNHHTYLFGNYSVLLLKYWGGGALKTKPGVLHMPGKISNPEIHPKTFQKM